MSGLNLALALLASKLEIYSDSQLIVGHIQGEYEAKDECMAQYLTKVRDTLNQLNEWVVKRIAAQKTYKSMPYLEYLLPPPPSIFLEIGNIIARPPPVYFLNYSHTCLQRQERRHKVDT